MIRKALTVTVAALVLGAASTPALTMERKGNLAVQFAGERNWVADCTVTKSDGKELKVSRRGRGNRSVKSIGIRAISGGSCTLTVPEGTTLKVSFNSTGTIPCPFDSNDPCVDYFMKPGAHTFSF